MKPAVDEMFPEGAGPYVDLDEVGSERNTNFNHSKQTRMLAQSVPFSVRSVAKLTFSLCETFVRLKYF